MPIQPTQAALELERQENATPHQLISLLMAGSLERIAQALETIGEENADEKQILLGKIIAIIDGLRSSLDFERGGELASNLDALYEYMSVRLVEASAASEQEAALREVQNLMGEVKSGWDALDKQAA